MISTSTKKSFNRFTRWVVVLTIFCSVALTSCKDDDEQGTQPTQTIVALAQANDNLSTLEAALTKFPDLVTTLSGNGTYTVFAPSNTAFQNLLSAIGQTNLNDVPEDVLRDILEYHVLSTTVRSTQLTSGDVQTVGGEKITVSVSGGSVKLNGNTNVTTADVEAVNGVVHIIDAVLVPPSITPIIGTVVAPAYFNKQFSTLIAAVKAASPSVLSTLLNSDKKTLFAPTNDAFAAAGITTLPERSVLDAVLTYHVIPSQVRAADIANNSSVATTLGGKIYISKVAAGVFINGKTKVTATDINASNGVVHVIDRTLLPPSQTIAQIATGYATAASNKQFTQLVAALARTQGQGDNDLLAAVSSAGSNLTVFAPTDGAFEALYDKLEVNGIDDIPLNTLIAVLKQHVVSGRVFSTDLVSGPVTTLNGNVTVSLTDNPPSVTSGSGNKANLQTSLLNINATNGVIHVIDQVLIPE